MKVVVDHIVYDIAAQPTDKHAYSEDVWEHAMDGHVEDCHY